MSWLGGIGFTMSLFVADLAFASPAAASLLTSAKLGILLASLVAGGIGWFVLARWFLRPLPSSAGEGAR